MKGWYFLFLIPGVLAMACQLGSVLPASTNQPSEVATLQPLQLPQKNVKTQQNPNPAFEDDRPLVARVNEQPIFLEQFEKQVTQYPEQDETKLKQIRQQVLESLIDQALIEQETARLGITISDEMLDQKIEANIEEGTELDTWLATNNMAQEEFRITLRSQLLSAQLFEHLTQLLPSAVEQIHLRHILLKDQAEAPALLERLKQGEDFATLAQNHSQDGITAPFGGDLGWFGQGLGYAPPEVERVAFALQPGEISGPIQTSQGFHIIQLVDKESQRSLSPEMLLVRKRRFFNHWLKEQRSTQMIERYITP